MTSEFWNLKKKYPAIVRIYAWFFLHSRNHHIDSHTNHIIWNRYNHCCVLFAAYIRRKIYGFWHLRYLRYIIHIIYCIKITPSLVQWNVLSNISDGNSNSKHVFRITASINIFELSIYTLIHHHYKIISYLVGDFDEHWFRYWLVALGHLLTNWPNVDSASWA